MMGNQIVLVRGIAILGSAEVILGFLSKGGEEKKPVKLLK
jgi:hypothetical protein